MTHSNPSTMIFLANPDVRAIAVIYEDIDINRDTTKMKYSPEYLSGGRLPEGATIFKTMDKDIKINDFVIVPTNTRHGMTVCKVVAVDVTVDYNSSEQCHWIVDKVDTTRFESLRQQEDAMIIAIREKRVDKERRALQKEFIEGIGDIEDIPMLTLDVSPRT